MLNERPQVLTALLRRFNGVSDPYISERLYAVAYGCVLTNLSPSAISDVAGVVYDLVFAADQPPVHVLLRDYARGVIERAVDVGVLPTNVDLVNARPPYDSPWPLEPTDANALQSDLELDDYWTFRRSVGRFGDFGIYVVEPSVQSFADPDQEGRKQVIQRSLDAKWEHERKDREKRIEVAHAEFVASAPREIVADLETLNAADGAGLVEFLRRLTTGQKILFLAAYGGRSRTPTALEVVSCDTDVAGRWIFERVKSLGWTPEFFAEFDRREVTSNRHGRHAERIGKKYQWIALHELVAPLADHCPLLDKADDKQATYDGPWQLRHSPRDIDPSLLDTVHERAAHVWWAQVQPVLPAAVDQTAVFEWLQRGDDLPPTESIIDVVSPDGQRWLVLEGWYEWDEPVPAEVDPHSIDRSSLQYLLRSYVIPRYTGPPELRGFSRNLRRDWDAVHAGLTERRSSGSVEGNVNKLKVTKRQMFGSARFDLLRKRVLLAN